MAPVPDGTSNGAPLDESLQGSLRGTAIAFIVLNTLFYAQRLYSRHLQETKWGIEDIVMVAAYIVAQGVCIDCLISLNFGVGIHFDLFEATTPELFPSWGANSLYALPILFTVASTLPKISILILYLRIFIQPWMRVCCWITMAILVLSCVLNVFLFGFQCNPVHAAWDPKIQDQYCNDILSHLTYSPITNIVTDVAMLLLPLPILLKLNAPRSVKIGLACTFLLGSLGVIASCVRFAIFVIYEYNWDYTWVTAQMSIWSCIESSVYFISACLLLCRPLLGKLQTWQPVETVIRRIRSATGFSRSKSSSEAKKSTASSGRARGPSIKNALPGGTPGSSITAGREEDELHMMESREWNASKELANEGGITVQREISVETTSI